MNCKYKEICRKHGCKCKVFTQCPANFRNQIGNPELIVVFTKTVAHKMLATVSKQAGRNGIKVHYANSSSASALQEVLAKYFQPV